MLMRIKMQLLTAAVLAIGILVPVTASATSITTGFTGTTVCRHCGNFFDVTTFANSLNVFGLEINVGTGSIPVDVYIKSGSYVGFETNAAAWTLASSNTVTGLGQGLATLVDITDFMLPANSVTAMYVMQGLGTDVYYDSVASTFLNADLQLDLGKSGVSNFSTTIYSPRTWNGTINYNAVPEPTTLALMGLGLAGIGWKRRKAA